VAASGDPTGGGAAREDGEREPARSARTGSGGGAGGGDDHGSGAETTLPPLAEGQRLPGRFEPAARQTRPPPRYTEATLLGAMEYAGRELDDEDLRAAMKDTGLGTPATRAATIETLLARRFISRQGKQIVPTPTGIAIVDRLPVSTLASPELTGAWEARLARIARGQESRAAFMADIVRFVGQVTDALRAAPPGSPSPAPSSPAPRPSPPSQSPPAPASSPPAPSPPLTCPRCRRAELVSGKRGWGCARWREGCPFVIWFEAAGKKLTAAELRDLVEKGKTRKRRWAPATGAAVSGRLVLDLAATREAGAARFEPQPQEGTKDTTSC
jgi:DNA topoisomerase-3